MSINHSSLIDEYGSVICLTLSAEHPSQLKPVSTLLSESLSFRIENFSPVPAELGSIDLYGLAYFHAMSFQWEWALEVLLKMGETADVVANLCAQSKPSIEQQQEALTWIQSRPGAKEAFIQIRANLAKYNALSVQDWKVANYGPYIASMRTHQIEMTSDLSYEIWLTMDSLNLKWVSQLSRQFDSLLIQAIGADATKQVINGYQIHPKVFVIERESPRDGHTDWLKHPPEWINPPI